MMHQILVEIFRVVKILAGLRKVNKLEQDMIYCALSIVYSCDISHFWILSVHYDKIINGPPIKIAPINKYFKFHARNYKISEQVKIIFACLNDLINKKNLGPLPTQLCNLENLLVVSTKIIDWVYKKARTLTDDILNSALEVIISYTKSSRIIPQIYFLHLTYKDNGMGPSISKQYENFTKGLNQGNSTNPIKTTNPLYLFVMFNTLRLNKLIQPISQVNKN